MRGARAGARADAGDGRLDVRLEDGGEARDAGDDDAEPELHEADEAEEEEAVDEVGVVLGDDCEVQAPGDDADCSGELASPLGVVV